MSTMAGPSFFVLLYCLAGVIAETVRLAPVMVPPEERHSLFDNMEKNVTWDDPKLLRMLYGSSTFNPLRPHSLTERQTSRHSFDKRAPGGTPLISIPCLNCGGIKPSVPVKIEQFTSSYFKSKAFARTEPCLFYGQRPADVVRATGKTSLSQPASEAASAANLRTIWFMLPSGTNGCELESNFYCGNYGAPTACCWLNPLMEPLSDPFEARKARMLPYFQQMSKGFAETCDGRVYIALDDPNRITDASVGTGDSIWISHELPSLRARYPDQITGLFVLPVGGRDGSTVARTSQAKDYTWALQSKKKGKREFSAAEIEIRHARYMMQKRRALDKAGLLHSVHDNNTHIFDERGGSDPWSNEGPNVDFFG